MSTQRSTLRAPSAAELEAAGLEPRDAARLATDLERAFGIADPLARWRHISKTVLRPDHRLGVHRLVHRLAFADWPAERGPAPAWVPSPEEIAATNAGRVSDDFRVLHRLSVEQPERFWSDMLARLGIVRVTEPRAILDTSEGIERARWLPGMRANIAESVFARPSSQVAVRWQRENGGAIETRTLGELERDCDRVARALRAAGFMPGDAIAIAMPMTYESVVIYLGIVMYGAVVVSIADSFASDEIATRLRIAGAKGAFTQDDILRGDRRLPLYARLVEAGAPRTIVLPAAGELSVELRADDRSWSSFLADADTVERPSRFHIADVDEPTNVLFSSGTTGDPKAIVWTHVTPIKAATDGWGHHDIRAGDVVAWPTNLGWMMGPWLIYASLLNGASMALYYGRPHTRGFGEFVERAGVTMLGVVPSLVKAWLGEGCMEGLDWSRIRCFSSTGEASSPDEMLWLMARAGYKPVIEYCGGTEIGGGYITGSLLQPQVPSAFSTPALGCDFVIIDERGRRAESGELALIPPMLGSSNRLLNADHHEVYFANMPPGPEGQLLRRHGDQMEQLPGGYHRAHGRVDDTMNLGGIKTSSAEIERALSGVPGVRETAAIAVSPPGGGPSQLVIYAVSDGASLDPVALRAAFDAAIRKRLNPLFKVHEVVIAGELPRTASNKVMRRVLRDRYRSRA